MHTHRDTHGERSESNSKVPSVLKSHGALKQPASYKSLYRNTSNWFAALNDGSSGSDQDSDSDDAKL
jgi:hypothetical protein